MTLYVLDTDHISLYQKSHPQVASRVQAADAQEIAVTIISAEEQLRGWFDAIRQAKSGERLHWTYLGLRQSGAICNPNTNITMRIWYNQSQTKHMVEQC